MRAGFLDRCGWRGRVIDGGRLDRLSGGRGLFGLPVGTAARFTNNNGTVHQGGTCFGDSGGPTFYDRTNVVVAVTSFGISPNCTGTDDEYRIDQSDDLAFLAGFGVTP